MLIRSFDLMKLFFSVLLLTGFTFCPAFAQFAPTTTYGMYAGDGGAANTHIGAYAGRYSTGHYNTFLGDGSGYSNTTGSYNTFLGSHSGFNNVSGSYNTFLGNYSGRYSTTGNYNTFLGNYSGYSNNGTRNVFIGYFAGYNEKGSNKFYVANTYLTSPLLYGDFSTNTLSIGTKYTGTAYSLVASGSVRASTYDVFSDDELKENVKRLPNALAKVRRVEGVSYLYPDNSAQAPVKKVSHYGFLAQNIQQVFPELVTEEEGSLAVNYQGMIPVLVEALKSLSLQQDSVSQLKAQLTRMQQQNQQLEAENQQIQSELTLIKQALQAKGLLKVKAEPGSSSREQASSLNPAVVLSQNQPNPFHQTTTIVYQAPTEAKQVSLIITNFSGMEVQRFANLPAPTGEVTLTAGSLPPGTYVYTLVVDGQAAASHKMVLTK